MAVSHADPARPTTLPDPGTPENSWGINCVILEGPMVQLVYPDPARNVRSPIVGSGKLSFQGPFCLKEFHYARNFSEQSFGKILEESGRKKAHKHKAFALVNVQMALGQAAGCPRLNRAKKFMCSSRNTGNINFPLMVNRRVVPGVSRLSKSLCVQSLCVPFSCPHGGIGRKGFPWWVWHPLMTHKKLLRNETDRR